eukprot:GHVQ01000224.1.p1 GENE.GHVQ01000224.1~~GHVQ01000224.1.p1  ORF type:complete len:327 (+),score=38.32 GHVQ01000224.1:22-1002(+)
MLYVQIVVLLTWPRRCLLVGKSSRRLRLRSLLTRGVKICAMKSGGGNSDLLPAVVKPEYERPPFKNYISRVSQSTVKLIKVPKAVAEAWRNAPSNNTVAVLTNSERGDELHLRPSEADNSSEVNKLIGRNVETVPKIYILSSKNDNKRYADVAATVGENILFTAALSGSYRKVLRQKHEERDIQKSRGTKEENRPESAVEEGSTLFRYYEPGEAKDEHGFEEVTTLSVAGKSRPKGRAKQQPTLSEDELKIRLFSMFEEAGDEGLMLKQIVVATGQPLAFVKGVVEEIAEPGRRKTDKRVVFFVKDHFNPNAVMPDEQILKKPRLR